MTGFIATTALERDDWNFYNNDVLGLKRVLSFTGSHTKQTGMSVETTTFRSEYTTFTLLPRGLKPLESKICLIHTQTRDSN